MINTPYAVIGGLVYGYLVFMILPIYASLERMDGSLIEAGKDLFGTPLRTFLHVTLPQTKQGILAGCVLVFLPAVGDFVAAQLLGGPDTYMIGNLIQDQFFAASNWPFGSALTVVMMLFLSFWLVGYLRSAARDARRGGGRRREPQRRLRQAALPARSTRSGSTCSCSSRSSIVVLFSFNSVKSLQSFQGFSLQWYEEFFSDPTLRESLFVSLRIAADHDDRRDDHRHDAGDRARPGRRPAGARPPTC